MMITLLKILTTFKNGFSLFSQLEVHYHWTSPSACRRAPAFSLPYPAALFADTLREVFRVC